MFLPSDKPSPPRNLRVTEVYKTHISLAWDAPDHDGGSAITSYIIEKADAKRQTFSNAGTTEADDLTLKVTKLYEGSQYLFKVYAENDIGCSQPASLDEPVEAKLPFGESSRQLSIVLYNMNHIKEVIEASAVL